MSYLEIRNVSKTLGLVHTLNNVSLSVNRHEAVVILGPSGCGKSTLLNIVAGLIPPDEGQIYVDGRNWTGKTGRMSTCNKRSAPSLPHHFR